MPFFDNHQRATLAAAMARIVPTDETAGATEAGAIDFLDGYLSGVDRIYALPDGSGFEALSGPRRAAWESRIEILRAKYVDGVRELDRLAREHHDAGFAELGPDQQDDVLRAMERAEPQPREAGASASTVPAYSFAPTKGAQEEGKEGPALQQTNTETELDFFPLLVVHTRQGFLADPIYGGNRDRVGWEAIGFPGPASLAEVHSGRYDTLPWFAETDDGQA